MCVCVCIEWVTSDGHDWPWNPAATQPSDVQCGSSQPNASGLAFETGPRPLDLLDDEENGGFECERVNMFECVCVCMCVSGDSLTFDLNNVTNAG